MKGYAEYGEYGKEPVQLELDLQAKKNEPWDAERIRKENARKEVAKEARKMLSRDPKSKPSTFNGDK